MYVCVSECMCVCARARVCVCACGVMPLRCLLLSFSRFRLVVCVLFGQVPGNWKGRPVYRKWEQSSSSSSSTEKQHYQHQHPAPKNKKNKKKKWFFYMPGSRPVFSDTNFRYKLVV